MEGHSCKLTILHFNDVYNVESREKPEPIGGAARMQTAFKQFSDLNPLIIFCGDALSPSMLSTFTKGEQMIPVLNQLGTHCAVYGNHDFDFGMDPLNDLVKGTNFPWLMSNVIDKETNRPLAEGNISKVIEWEGCRIGLVGLVEKEWLDTLAAINPNEVIYTDFVESANTLAADLKDNQNCDIVIALTHMRQPNDIKLAENSPRIDLILGGHDHDVQNMKVNNKLIIKSGTDFRNFTLLTLSLSPDKRTISDIETKLFDVTAEYTPDDEMDNSLQVYREKMEGEMTKELGVFEVDLDGRFSTVRSMESNLCNFVTDIMVAATEADFALINSGTFRSDTIHKAGIFTIKDLLLILPMIDPLVLVEVDGEQIMKCLENGVSKYPKLEGRFPQVSGISFEFDGSKPPGERVDRYSVKIGDEFVFPRNQDDTCNPPATYRMVTKGYLAQGKDGYPCLLDGKVFIDEENGPLLRFAVQNHFEAINMRKGRTKKVSVHHQSLITLSRRNPLLRQLTEENVTHRLPATLKKSFRDVAKNIITIGSVTKAFRDIQELETTTLAPKVEGRIIRTNT